MTTPTALSNRTPEEVFTHHAQAFEAEDLDAILLDYAPTPPSSARLMCSVARTRYARSLPR